MPKNDWFKSAPVAPPAKHAALEGDATQTAPHAAPVSAMDTAPAAENTEERSTNMSTAAIATPTPVLETRPVGRPRGTRKTATTLKLSPDTMRTLRVAAAEHGATISGIVEQLVIRFLADVDYDRL